LLKAEVAGTNVIEGRLYCWSDSVASLANRVAGRPKSGGNGHTHLNHKSRQQQNYYNNQMNNNNLRYSQDNNQNKKTFSNYNQNKNISWNPARVKKKPAGFINKISGTQDKPEPKQINKSIQIQNRANSGYSQGGNKYQGNNYN